MNRAILDIEADKCPMGKLHYCWMEEFGDPNPKEGCWPEYPDDLCPYYGGTNTVYGRVYVNCKYGEG